MRGNSGETPSNPIFLGIIINSEVTDSILTKLEVVVKDYSAYF
jgi:hypothetical protein